MRDPRGSSGCRAEREKEREREREREIERERESQCVNESVTE